MRANNIGARGFEVLAPALAVNQTLRVIDLGLNDWCPEKHVRHHTLRPAVEGDQIVVGASVLYRMTRECDEIDLSACTFGKPSVAVVVEAKDRDGDVKIAILSGAHALAQVVQANSSLREIRCAPSTRLHARGGQCPCGRLLARSGACPRNRFLEQAVC